MVLFITLVHDIDEDDFNVEKKGKLKSSVGCISIIFPET